MSSEGENGYRTRDKSWAIPATLFDKEGHVSWHSSGTFPGVDDSLSGDIFGDGRLSVVIGYDGSGGLALLDSQGKTLCKKEESNVLALRGVGFERGQSRRNTQQQCKR